jgi:hypothetical protein
MWFGDPPAAKLSTKAQFCGQEQLAAHRFFQKTLPTGQSAPPRQRSTHRLSGQEPAI